MLPNVHQLIFRIRICNGMSHSMKDKSNWSFDRNTLLDVKAKA